MGRQVLGNRPRVEKGGANSNENGADSGTGRRAQRRIAEAGGWRVHTMYRWAEICDRRGVMERVIHGEKDLTTNGC